VASIPGRERRGRAIAPIKIPGARVSFYLNTRTYPVKIAAPSFPPKKKFGLTTLHTESSPGAVITYHVGGA